MYLQIHVQLVTPSLSLSSPLCPSFVPSSLSLSSPLSLSCSPFSIPFYFCFTMWYILIQNYVRYHLTQTSVRAVKAVQEDSKLYLLHLYTVTDIIKFTFYHCTSIDYSVLCEWSTLYFECTTQYYTLVLSYHIKGIHTLIWLQYKVVL